MGQSVVFARKPPARPAHQPRPLCMHRTLASQRHSPRFARSLRWRDLAADIAAARLPCLGPKLGVFHSHQRFLPGLAAGRFRRAYHLSSLVHGQPLSLASLRLAYPPEPQHQSTQLRRRQMPKRSRPNLAPAVDMNMTARRVKRTLGRESADRAAHPSSIQLAQIDTTKDLPMCKHEPSGRHRLRHHPSA